MQQKCHKKIGVSSLKFISVLQINFPNYSLSITNIHNLENDLQKSYCLLYLDNKNGKNKKKYAKIICSKDK